MACGGGRPRDICPLWLGAKGKRPLLLIYNEGMEKRGHIGMCTRRGFVSLAAGALLAGCSSRATAPEQLQTTFFSFDTVCTVGGIMSQEVLDALVERCQWFEEHLSRTFATSDVGRINAACGAPVEVEPETAEVIRAALGYSRDSGGLFDITIGAVTELWDFSEGVVPDPADIEQALPHVGWEGVSVDGTTVTLADPDARIDLGGIAKGFITDDLIARLVGAGVESAFINLGGNVAVLGNKPDGSPWGIGVRDPFDESGQSNYAMVRTSGGSMVTSGLYERQFEANGRRYWHILDPRTGYPVESHVVSATVFSERSIDGDGLTKPLFMMDEDQALAFLEDHGVQGMLIHEDGSAVMTDGAEFDLL